ncbi:MAG: hypothetical protein ACUVUU_08375 [bacterium]
MQRDRSTHTGLPRQEIDWFPRIDQEKCKEEVTPPEIKNKVKFSEIL